MKVRTIERKDYDKLNKLFCIKVQQIETENYEKLKNDKIPLPLASNFAWGETFAGTINGSASSSLPVWAKELLQKVWNETIDEYFKK